jgi:hypothetical protein
VKALNIKLTEEQDADLERMFPRLQGPQSGMWDALSVTVFHTS